MWHLRIAFFIALQLHKVGLGKRNSLSEEEREMLQRAHHVCIENFFLTAIIQELLFARTEMRNRKRGNEKSQMVVD